MWDTLTIYYIYLTPRQFGEALNERRNKYGRSNDKRKRNR